MVEGLTSPNISTSFRRLIACSSWMLRVSVSYCWSTVFTRHTMPAPGSFSSRSQSPTPISGASGPTVSVAVLCLSDRSSRMVSGVNRSLTVRLWGCKI